MVAVNDYLYIVRTNKASALQNTASSNKGFDN